MAQLDPSRATAFGGWAAEYDRWRPSYPEEAVAWLLPPNAQHVVEVGAGTGKLTDRLVNRGIALDVVEPDGRMLDLVRERHPNLRVHESAATALPVADGSVDAVLVADAWHWFLKVEAAQEIARVLRPGGWLGAVWNLVAPRTPWEWELHGMDPTIDVAGRDDQDALALLGLTEGHAERRAFPFAWMVTPKSWRGFRSTVSQVALLPEPDRVAHLDRAEQMVTEVCTQLGASTIPLHHETVCIRWWPHHPGPQW